jgi:hypothetical protein
MINHCSADFLKMTGRTTCKLAPKNPISASKVDVFWRLLRDDMGGGIQRQTDGTLAEKLGK